MFVSWMLIGRMPIFTLISNVDITLSPIKMLYKLQFIDFFFFLVWSLYVTRLEYDTNFYQKKSTLLDIRQA